MELTALNNTCLSNQVTTNFATEWSKDGRIFIVTDAVVYILKFSPCMTNVDNNFTFTKSEINVGEYHAANHTGIDMDEILNNLSQAHLYRAVLNANLTPKVTGGNPIILRPIAASWSPASLYKNIAALLAVLSSTGNVEIFVQKKTKWFCLTNIIPHWIKHLRPSWNYTLRTDNCDAKCELHEERVLQYLATCMSWSVVYKEKNSEFCYISLGHGTGKISVWKINSIESDMDDLYPAFIYSCDTGMKRITAIHWCTVDENLAWIVVGDLGGVIKCIPIVCVHSEKFNAGKIVDIYTEKDIRVSYITCVKFDNNEYFLAMKGSFVTITRVSITKGLEFIKHLNVGNITVSGIQPMKHGCFMIIATTGVLKAIKLIKSGTTVDYKIFPIKNDIKWNYHAAHGLIKSPNGTLWGVLMHPCKIIDHLILRQPIQITFCTTTKFDPGNVLRANPTGRLQNAWECLEIIRCSSAKNNTLPSVWLARCKNYDDFPLYELQIFMWISVSCQLFIQRRTKCRKLKTFLPAPEILKQIVFFKFHLLRLKYLLDIYDKKQASQFQINSIYILLNAVINFSKDDSFEKYLSNKSKDELNAVIERAAEVNFSEIPKCCWCEEDLSSQSCSSNHPDHRCGVSGVQIQGIAKWECSICSLAACGEIEDDYLKCPLCDIPFISNY